MGLFGIRNRKEEETHEPTVDVGNVNAAAESILKSDISLKPDEIDMNSREVRTAVLREVRRQRSNEHVLTPAQLSRTKDALNLATTKLENIEENLQKCHDHLDWIHRYNELQSELDHHRTKQFAINKQVAVMAKEEQELERYESFETIQSAYQRLQLLIQQRHDNTMQQAKLAHEVDELQKQLYEEQRRLDSLTEERKEAETQYTQSHEVIEQAQRMEVKLVQLEQRGKKLTTLLNDMRNKQRGIEKELLERQEALESINNQALDDRSKAQALLCHQRMVEHAEGIIGKIEYLDKLAMKRNKLDAEVKESQRKQTERNSRMVQVYEQCRSIESKMSQLIDELKVHRYNNHGLDSYKLQSRAMSLRSTKLMMLSAQSLWSRIVMGYNMIENFTQRQTKVRLDLDGLQKNIEEAESALAILRRTTKEKEYSYTLSKSQSVIQLRNDLKEGVQCTVCGATHHPYHSDTILAQNKVIGDIKWEYESLMNELKKKEQELHDMYLDQAAKNSEKECLSAFLHSLRQRQNEDVKEWSIYSKLDPSFSDCSPSTNLEARATVLRQLIENISRDVEEAQAKLDDFNFNQKRINELNEEISTLEQEKDGLTVRLNELNTGCQVLAGQVERLQQQYESTFNRYTKLHDELSKTITISGWEQDLRQGYETVIVNIQRVVDEYNKANERVLKNEHQREMAQVMLAKIQESAHTIQVQLLEAQADMEDCQKNEEDTKQNLRRLLPDYTSKQYYEVVVKAYEMARQAEDIQAKRVNNLVIEYNKTSARLTEVAEYKEQLDELYTTERTTVDEWVREFNTCHPPVQYTELERVYGENKDWNADRKRIRDLKMEALLLQSKVDNLRGQLIGLQAEGYRIPNKDEDVQETLAAQTDSLEKQRREVMMQIATYKLTIDMHNKSIEEQKIAEEEGLTL